MASSTVVRSGALSLPVKVWGDGQELVFFNGAGSTQVTWRRVIGELAGDYTFVTFDFRGHGKATDSADYSFSGFMSDASAVMDAVGRTGSILVGWSLGADLALSYAMEHPDRVGGLVLVDGAVPIPEPLVEDEAAMRRSLNSPFTKLGMLLTRLTPYAYRLTGDEIADLAVETDRHRQQILDVFAKVACPIAVVLATKTAGEETSSRARRNNGIWRSGAERLHERHPSISIEWIDAAHTLPLKMPAQVAQAIDALAQRVATERTGQRG